MKKTLKVLMMLGCFPMMLSAKEYKKSESLNLDKGWEFAQVGRNEWLPATVPGTVHQDLICLLYTSPSPRDAHESRMPSSA